MKHCKDDIADRLIRIAYEENDGAMPPKYNCLLSVSPTGAAKGHNIAYPRRIYELISKFKFTNVNDGWIFVR